MKLKDMPIEELEILSYADLTYLLLKENKRAMNTPTLFREICNLLEYTDDEYAAKIGDYYTSLNNDKRFVLLDTAEWDIRDNHSVEIVIDDDDEDEAEEQNDEDEEIEEELEEDIDTIVDDNDLDDDDDDDDMEDLAIVEDEEDLED